MLPADLVKLRKSLDDAIARHGLSAMGDAIHRAAVPQIWMPYDPADLRDDSGPLGGSRLGGEPDLPPDVAWPSRDGEHLPFIAQLDCAALPRWADSPLPASGWLYAFAGGEFPMESALIHWTGNRAQLQRRATPDDDAMLISDNVTDARFVVVPLRQSRVIVNLPQAGEAYRELDAATGGSEELERGLQRLIEELAYGAPGDPDVAARVLGLISFASDDSPSDFVVKWGRRSGGDDWISLLEIASVGSMQWSDAGILSFLVRSWQLARMDLSNSYAMISSS